jgi:hypothetical protein
MWKEFEHLSVFEGALNSASAIGADQSGRVALCKAADSSPFFLVRVGSSISRPSFRLRYVTFQFDMVYEMDVGGSKSTDICVRIACDDKNVFRHKVFVEAISAVVSECSGSEPLVLIDALIELFSRPKSSRSMSLTGLWGELLFILSHANCDEAVLAWHSEPNQLRDFVFLERSVEVKTTASGERKHYFSLPQVTTARDGDLLCSIMVEATDSGMSLMDLATLVADKCAGHSRPFFWSKFMPIADDLLPDYEDCRFELERALKSIQFFELLKLNHPVITGSGIGSVRDVSFSLSL